MPACGTEQQVAAVLLILHRLVEAVAVTVLMLAHKERAKLLAAPFVGAEDSPLAVSPLELAVHRFEVVDLEGERAGFTRFVLGLRDQPDLNPVAPTTEPTPSRG